MKKTVLSVIVAIVIIVAVVVGAYFILNGSEEEKTIDLNTASQHYQIHHHLMNYLQWT